MSCDPSKRLFIKGIVAAYLLSFSKVGFATALTQIFAIRIWPSSTYTRITLESNLPLQYEQFILVNPDRIVIDIDDLYLNQLIKNIQSRLQPRDPFIKQLRVSQYKDDIVRLVIELKQAVNPTIFNLQPIAEFKYRFVIDLYPVVPMKDDAALVALLEQFNKGSLHSQSKPVATTSVKTRKEPIIVMLDPGHGGEDPGAIGYRGTKEKDIVLQIAHKVRNLMKNNAAIAVYMTRNEDIFIPLSVRVAKARAIRADLFVSIHADAFTQRSVKGSSVFMLSRSGASSIIAGYLAKTQNEADDIGGVSRSGDRYLDHTLLDLVQTSTMDNSAILAKQVLNQIKSINKLHKSTTEQARFTVLKAPDVPSILIETAFISNLDEEKRLKSTSFQNQMAKSIYQGILRYISLRKR